MKTTELILLTVPGLRWSAELYTIKRLAMKQGNSKGKCVSTFALLTLAPALLHITLTPLLQTPLRGQFGVYTYEDRVYFLKAAVLLLLSFPLMVTRSRPTR